MDALNSEAVCLKMDLLEERKENKIKEDCNMYVVAYVPPSLANSTRQLMVDSIRNKKNRLWMENTREQLTPEEKELTRAKDRRQKATEVKTSEEKELTRAKDWKRKATEVKTPEEKELTRAKDQKRKAIEVKTPEEKKQTRKSNTALQQRSRGSKKIIQKETQFTSTSTSF